MRCLNDMIPSKFRLSYAEILEEIDIQVNSIGDIEGYIYDRCQAGASKTLIEAELKLKKGAINKTPEYLQAYENGKLHHVRLAIISNNETLFNPKSPFAQIQAQNTRLEIDKRLEYYREEKNSESDMQDYAEDLTLDSLISELHAG